MVFNINNQVELKLYFKEMHGSVIILLKEKFLILFADYEFSW